MGKTDSIQLHPHAEDPVGCCGFGRRGPLDDDHGAAVDLVALDAKRRLPPAASGRREGPAPSRVVRKRRAAAAASCGGGGGSRRPHLAAAAALKQGKRGEETSN